MSPVLAPSDGLPRAPIRSLSEAQRTCREIVGRVDPTLLSRSGPRCGCQIALQQTTERLLDYLVGTAKQWERDREAERIGVLEIDGHLNFRDLLHRQVGRLIAAQNAAGVAADQ